MYKNNLNLLNGQVYQSISCIHSKSKYLTISKFTKWYLFLINIFAGSNYLLHFHERHMAVMRLMVRQACRCTVSWEIWSVVRATVLTSGQPHNTASMLTWTGCPHDICSPRTQSEPYPDAVSVTWINIKIFKDAEYIYL